ncbi:hypothetical protein HPB48_004470 [Haemaphysalis longicornis]|uniref:Uncharacterized protein n=1 Tax=Haemaphysalis longicornis TaxID=44386 RepID=A0A9J6GKY8_HAELO|nr:hypothetical protein HPB48_004470 [Haemaphysalis longicornis]
MLRAGDFTILRHYIFNIPVCRHWRRLASEPAVRRKIDASSVELTVPKLWSLLQTHADANVRAIRIRGDGGHFNRRLWEYKPKIFKCLTHQCPFLTVLEFKHADLFHNKRITRMSITQLPPTLTHLFLRQCDFHPAQFFRTAEGRAALPALQLLDLGDFWCPPSHIDLGSLDQWPSLRALGLEAWRSVKDKGLRDIFPLLGFLFVLDLEGTRMSENGLEVILLKASNLKYLFVGSTKICGRAFSSVRKHVGCVGTLKITHLCMRNTRVTEISVFQLLKMTPNLRWLAVTSANLPQNALTRVEAALPKGCRFEPMGPVEDYKCCSHFATDVVKCLKLNELS